MSKLIKNKQKFVAVSSPENAQSPGLGEFKPASPDLGEFKSKLSKGINFGQSSRDCKSTTIDALNESKNKSKVNFNKIDHLAYFDVSRGEQRLFLFRYF